MEIARLADLPVFPKGDGTALSRILEGLNADRQLMSEIARKGQEVALREFSSERMVSRFLQSFESICERKPDTGKIGQAEP